MNRILYILFVVLVFCIISIGDSNAQIIKTVAGTGTGGYSGDGGPATATQIWFPQQMVADVTGIIYLSDNQNHRIRKIDTNGIITTIAGTGTSGYSGDGGPATAADLSAGYLALDHIGKIYLPMRDRLRRVDTSGIITTIAGTGVAGYGGDGGQASAAQFRSIGSVAVDKYGRIFICDFNGIRMIDTSGVITTVIGNVNTNGFWGDGGPASAALLDRPVYICFDTSDNLYIADGNNYRIRKVTPSGIIQTIAGTGGTSVSGDGGPATAAQIAGPSSIALDKLGNLYFSAGFPGLNRVRKIDTNGIVSTYAGRGDVGFSGDYCSATDAYTSSCRGVTAYNNYLYFIDYTNHRIRRVEPGHRPHFATGSSGTLRVCSDTMRYSLDTLLAVVDTDEYQVQRWATVRPPAHGTLAAADTLSATGPTYTPSGLYYRPDTAYSGYDTFRVRVVDCGYETDTITIYVEINPLPAPITGAVAVCQGNTATLSCATAGGIWVSAAAGIATMGSTSGTLYGVSPGGTTISYTIGTGCRRSTAITVHPAAGTITGGPNVCMGWPVVLTNTVSGGRWASGNTAIATVDSVSGSALATAAGGSAVISYTMPTGCFATTTVSGNPAPAAISGSLSVCIGTLTTLSNSGGGTWSASPTHIATIGTTSGIAAGVSAGTATITYSLPTGCKATSTLTVHALPGAITGPASLCTGTTATLGNSLAGGTWSAGAGLVATIGTSSGIITGIAPGTASITYTIGGACSVQRTITVHPLPAPITGPSVACLGQTNTLTSATPGGFWTSTNPVVATVAPAGSGIGVVSGRSVGSATISYTLLTGCAALHTVSVAAPPAAITGPASACVSGTAAHANATTGGVWSSSLPTIATIDPVTGVATALLAGTATISYTSPGGCAATRTFTVHPSPAPITGAAVVCGGSRTTFSSTTSGGTWASSNTSIATVFAASGIISGVSLGTATITYALPTGCIATRILTVSLPPGPITGPSSICAGATAAYSNSVSGGVWSSSDVSVATVDPATGMAMGVASGYFTLSYNLGSCFTGSGLSVTPSPSAIFGPSTLCTGTSATLTSSSTSGSWSSSATSIASINASSGVVTELSTGTVTISYTFVATGCYSIATLAVSPAPGPILGPASICAGSTATLSNSVAGGTWANSNPTVATIGTSTGIISGMAVGTATITYSLGGGCLATRTVSVLPGATISGSTSICAGAATTLFASMSGGTWGSSMTSVATVGLTTGFVSGLSVGSSIMSYTLPSGCVSITTILVNARPGTISGAASLCAGATATLSNPVPGGTWAIGSTSIATADAVSGMITGVSAGVATITYSLGSGCTTTSTLAVLPLPAPIIGPPILCLGASISLTSTPAGGTWGTTYGSIVSVGSSTGIVTGISPGGEIITYTLPAGCSRTINVSVSPTPAAILGTLSVCPGSPITLSSTDAGGIWAAPGYAATATVGLYSGVVYGVSPGTARISYTTSGGCPAVTVTTVLPLPTPILGVAGVCAGAGTTMSHALAGGAWQSSDPSVADIDASTGVLASYSAGTTLLTYTTSGCPAYSLFTVYPLPAPISGSTGICAGLSATMASATVSGIWASSASAIATVGSATGVLSAVVAGTATISYTLPTGCGVVTGITVYPSPPPIIGSRSLCVGGTATLSNLSAGGSWTSSHPSTAPIDASTGIVSGSSMGTATISYALGGCPALATVTVHALPAPITGAIGICAWGGTLTLSSVTTGGGWSSSVVTISSAGVATAHAAGAAVVTYTLPTGCAVTTGFPVHPLPAFITGTTSICLGNTATLSDSVTGGRWSSSATGIATIGSTTGIYTGLLAGGATIYYTLPTGCARSTLMNILPVPDAILGPGSVCAGATITLTSTSTGGTWQSGNPSVALLDTFSGYATGVVAGAAMVTYRLGSGCYTTRSLTVHNLPTRYSVTGGGNYCAGGSGRAVGLGMSVRGVAYQLYLGSSPLGSAVGGIGSSLGFGLQTLPGTYTVMATDTATGCGRAMAGSATITVDTVVVPSVTYSPGAGHVICDGNPETFTATPVHGGSSPVYIWVKNGTTASTGSPVLTYIPINGDRLQVYLTSNAPCVSPDTASYTRTITVTEHVTPVFAIIASPGTAIAPGQTVTFSAVLTAGTAAAYQWRKNGTDIPGATGPVLVTAGLADGDTISCTITTTGPCPATATEAITITVTNTGLTSKTTGTVLTVLPNPSNGTFLVTGTIGGTGNAQLTVTDIAGRQIHSSVVPIATGTLNHYIHLPTTTPPGNYLLRVACDTGVWNVVLVVGG